MQYVENHNLINSFHLPCKVSRAWFPETYFELKEILINEPTANIVADCTNILCQPFVDKAICLTKMPKEISLINDSNDKYIILCNANVKSNVFIKYLLNNKISGYEDLYGLPGRLGSAIYGNSGSGATCISDYLTFVIALDRKGNSWVFKKEDLNFKRRYSILQDLNYVITDICFTFPKQSIDKDKLKKAKQHRLNFPKYPSAGGIFVNWIELKPYIKDLVGLKVGDAEVSHMANIIVNKGNATFEDVMNLIYQIKRIVNKPLELEVKII